MDNIKGVIAKNIVALRQKNSMTQFELAEKLNYSDKAVSKWERAESMPDITVLLQIADMFGVTLDYLVHSEHETVIPTFTEKSRKRKNRLVITWLSVLLVWLIATTVFVLVDIFTTQGYIHSLAFIYAVPISALVWLVFNSMWFNTKKNYLIISILMWSFLSSLYVTLLFCSYNPWQIFFLGVPGQVIILIWSRFKTKGKR